eukprot:1033413-Prymnesium_polylepis.2
MGQRFSLVVAQLGEAVGIWFEASGRRARVRFWQRLVVELGAIEPKADLVLTQPADGKRAERRAPREQLQPVRLIEAVIVAQHALKEGRHARADRIEAGGGHLGAGGEGEHEAVEQLAGRETSLALEHRRQQ